MATKKAQAEETEEESIEGMIKEVAIETTKTLGEEHIQEIIDHASAPQELKPGVMKEYTQNGIRYRRIRHEGGRIEDIRI